MLRSNRLLLLALVALSYAADDVVVLTEKNFDKVLKDNERVLVEFYAPWCGHCKRLEPEYSAAATKLKADGVKTVLAKVDATEEKKLATKFGIQGFPTLKYFTNGDTDSPADYGGGREKDSIVSWIKKRELPALSDITSKDQLETFSGSDRLVLVGFYKKDSDEAKMLKEIAEAKRDSMVCGIVTDDSALPDGVSMPAAILYRKFDDPKVTFDGKHTKEELTKFIDSERFPLLDQIGPNNYQDYMERALPLVWLAVKPSDADGTKAAQAAVMKAAKKFKGKLSFTWVDADKFSEHVESMGIASFPGLLIAGGADNTKYRLEDELNEKNVDAFFEKYEKGTLAKFMKSQEAPESNDEPVTVIVGKTFDDIAKDAKKSVLVEFYAPWCGHCKRLAPEYEKVGQHFRDQDSVVIAKVDATENDTPENIEGFPTLIFYGQDNKRVAYDGKRDAESIISFVEKESGVKGKAAAADTDSEDSTDDEGSDKSDL